MPKGVPQGQISTIFPKGQGLFSNVSILKLAVEVSMRTQRFCPRKQLSEIHLGVSGILFDSDFRLHRVRSQEI
jgi:hypothetical protein